jgi:hypothetical protein
MPVPLPPAPAGGTPLPEEPNDPPTLEDVYNAVQYFSEVKVDHGKLQFPSNETPFQGSDLWTFTETQMADAATQDDVARAAVYQTAVSVAHAADSQLLNKILYAVAHLSTDAVPPWFAPALTKALNNAFSPLKRSIARVSLFIFSCKCKLDILLQNYNLQCAGGNIRKFEIVPFQDGSLPEEVLFPFPSLY